MRRRLLESLPGGERPQRMRKPRPHKAKPSRPANRPAARGGSVRGRFLVAGAAVFCMLLVFSGLSLLLARDSLPGDSLYRFKQLAERASLGLTFNSHDRAVKHLDYAATRVNEIQQLAGDRLWVPANYWLALDDMDANARDGARALIQLGTEADGASLGVLRRWVNVEITQLAGLNSELPDQVRGRADESARLLDRIGDRVQELQARLHCQAITTGATDQIGLLPASGNCALPPSAAQQTPPSGPIAATTPGKKAKHGKRSSDRADSPDRSATPTLPGASLLPLPGDESWTGGSARGDSPPSSGAPPSKSVRVPLPLPVKPLPPLLPGLPGISFD